MSFDYTSIPEGYYDKIIDQADSIRSFWHWHKFSSVNRALGSNENKEILDIGCFAGSFLKTLDEKSFTNQIGVDILPEQVNYANSKYGTSCRKFLTADNFDDFDTLLGDGLFDYITVIEVIEHLNSSEVIKLMKKIHKFLKVGGECIITTPNYTSIWPILEWYLNNHSDVTYEEQHITKFNYFNFFSKLENIYPQLLEQFELTFKTTTHFIAPYLAGINYKFAQSTSSYITPKSWSFPFGSLILAKIVKKSSTS